VAERVLSERELNRALLARQLLLERSSLSIPRALEQVGGLQTQYAPSGYVGLWSRRAGFERGDLTGALERRRAVQGTLMRVTIHLVSARDHAPLRAAVRDARREWWFRTLGRGVEPATMEAAARRVRSALAAGPLRRDELVEILGGNTTVWSGVGLWVELVRAPPSGTWERRRADLFASADAWLEPADPSPEEGLDHLVRRYLGAFGPARPAEIGSWAGLRGPEIARGLARLRLRRFRDEEGAELVDVPRAPLPDPETPAPIRFLPTWDATLLVHARRKGVLAEERRPQIFSDRNPHSVGTFLVDGTVAGTWRFDCGRIATEPFGRPTLQQRRELAEEAERLAAFHG
jgi:hypothetical protein